MTSKEWNSLKKQPDKAKKMLSALHMSSAYLKVSWGDLDEGDQKKVSKWIAKNVSGWFEAGEPISTPKGIKTVAPKHHKAAVKKSAEAILRTPMKKEKSVREVKKEETPQKTPKEEEEVRSYPNYGLVWDGDISRQDITSTDYYRVITNPPKDVEYQGSKSFHGDSAALYFSKSKKETYIVPRDTKEYLIHLRNEPVKRELDIKCPECGHNMVSASKEYSEAVRGAVKEGTPICRVHGTLESIEQQTGKSVSVPEPEPESESKEESWLVRAKNAGISLDGLYINDIDGIKFRMMDGAFANKTAFRCPECYRGLVFNSDNKLACGEHGSLTSPDKAFDLRKVGTDKETTKWARMEYSVWLREARFEGFNTISEYVDAMKGEKTLSGETDNGYKQYAQMGKGFEKLFNSEAGKENTEINRKFFKKVSERVDDAYKEFDTTGDIKEYQEAYNTEFVKYYNALPEGDRVQLDSKIYGLSNYIHEKKLALKKKPELIEKDKSGTMLYLEAAYKSRLETLSTEPIPLSNPEADEIKDAIEFAKTSMVPILMHFDIVDVQIRYWRNTSGDPSRLEIIVFNEEMNPIYHNNDYDMNLTVEEVFRIRDSETNRMKGEEKEEVRKKDEARAQEEQKKKQFRFNKTTYSLYLKTYPYAMVHFLNNIVHIPLNADPQKLTDKELDMINEVVAEGYDIISDTGIYTVEWFKERDEMERADEVKYEAEQEKEKSYFKITSENNIFKKAPIKKPYPFTYQGIDFVSHFEGAGWHTSVAALGLMFTSGKSKNESETAAKETVDRRGSEYIKEQTVTARESLGEVLKKSGVTL